MRTRLLALILPALALAPLGAARAAVTEANFQMRTAADLVTLCSATPDDPLGTAAVNFCHGFAVGVYQTLSEEQAAMSQKFFCAPQPTPSRNQAIASFVSWARANPSALGERPADAIADYLTTRFPCPGR
jgi:hypothetical protein